MPGASSAFRAWAARRSDRSPSPNSPIQIALLGQREQRGRDHGFCAPAVPLGERYRLTAALLGRGQGTGCRREAELGQAGDLEIGAADLTGQGGALPQVAFGVGEGPGTMSLPRFGGSSAAGGSQVVGDRDLFAALPGHRIGEEPGLFDGACQVSVAPGEL